MDLYNRISLDDRLKIREWIGMCAGSDGCGSPEFKVDLDHILRFWNSNKKDLGKIFGDNLILSRNISIKKPFSLIEEELYERCFNYGSPGRSFSYAFDSLCEMCDLDYRLRYLLDNRYLATNIYGGEDFNIPDPKTKKPIQIHNGCKVSKMLGKIATAYNLEGYEEFRIQHSLILNNKNMNGELCISIHPLDYMTMSDNDCDWDSCMSWTQPGDYRQGTVEMMNSPYIVVAYLKSSTDMDFPYSNNTWNNKKWRELFVVSPEVIMGIRQYPYDADEVQGIVLNWLKELVIKNNNWGPYTENACEIGNRRDIPIAEFNITSSMFFSTNRMYNDIHQHHLAYVSKGVVGSYELMLSGESECMTCGRDCSYIDEFEPYMLVCLDCSDTVKCCECDSHINKDCACWHNGYAYCEYCYDDYIKECPSCKNLEHSGSLCRVFVYHNNKSTGNYMEICGECYSAFENKESDTVKLFGELFFKKDPLYGWITGAYVETKNFTSDKAWEAFWDNKDTIEQLKKELMLHSNILF